MPQMLHQTDQFHRSVKRHQLIPEALSELAFESKILSNKLMRNRHVATPLLPTEFQSADGRSSIHRQHRDDQDPQNTVNELRDDRPSQPTLGQGLFYQPQHRPQVITGASTQSQDEPSSPIARRRDSRTGRAWSESTEAPLGVDYPLSSINRLTFYRINHPTNS